MKGDRLQNRTALVTGGSSGIGRGISLRYAEEGARVVVADVRRQPKQGKYYDTDLTTPTDEVIREEIGGEALFLETDVSDPENVRETIEETVNRYGSLDVLVNNAGIYIPKGSGEIELEEWDRLLSIDLFGVFYCSKFALPHLKESRGHVVNISSVHGSEGGGGPSYASAKGGVINLTRDLAVELGPHEVNVNVICPGYIETPVQDYNTEEDIEASREHTVLPYFGKPRDIGDAAVFLASEESRFVTGTSLYVDGGWSAHRF